MSIWKCLLNYKWDSMHTVTYLDDNFERIILSLQNLSKCLVLMQCRSCCDQLVLVSRLSDIRYLIVCQFRIFYIVVLTKKGTYKLTGHKKCIQSCQLHFTRAKTIQELPHYVWNSRVSSFWNYRLFPSPIIAFIENE